MVVFYGLPKECNNNDMINIGSNFTLHKSNLVIGNSKYSLDQYCLVELPDGTTEAQVCMATDFSDTSTRIKCICMIISLIFFVLSWLLVWKYHKDKLFGAMTLGMIATLFLYFLTFLVMDLVELGKVLCNVSTYLPNTYPKYYKKKIFLPDLPLYPPILSLVSHLVDELYVH